MGYRREVPEEEKYVILLTDKLKTGAAIKAFGIKKSMNPAKPDRVFATEDPTLYAKFDDLASAEAFVARWQPTFYLWRCTPTQIGSGPSGVDMTPPPPKLAKKKRTAGR